MHVGFLIHFGYLIYLEFCAEMNSHVRVISPYGHKLCNNATNATSNLNEAHAYISNEENIVNWTKISFLSAKWKWKIENDQPP